jgi:hypothetical protein
MLKTVQSSINASQISALPAAAVALAGTEVLPIVQNGATVKVSVDNLTAGKPVSMSTLVVGAATPSAGFASDVRGSTIVGNGSASYYVDTGADANYTYVRGKGAALGMLLGTQDNVPLYFYVNGAIKGNIGTSGDLSLSSGGNFSQATAGKGITTGGAFNLGLGTNGSTSQANLTTNGSLLLNTTDLPYLYSGTSNAKGIPSLNNNQGKCIAGLVSSVAAGGIADFNVSFFAMGFLVVVNEYGAFATTRTMTTFSLFSRGGDNFTCTQIATADGSGGPATFSVTWTGSETIRITNTSAFTCGISMAYFGI